MIAAVLLVSFGIGTALYVAWKGLGIVTWLFLFGFTVGGVVGLVEWIGPGRLLLCAGAVALAIFAAYFINEPVEETFDG